MSMEMHVFYRGKLPTKTALNRTMKERGLPLTIAEATRPLEQHTGLIPMRWRGEDTGVEFDVWTDPAAVRGIGADGVDPGFDRTANFRWGGDISELLAAQSLAAALARLTGGVVFETEGGSVLSRDEAIGAAHATLQRLTANDKPAVRGTRRSDIRHYLKPLLAERKDLILRGNFLIITPVRHILRGAWLSGKFKYYCKINRYQCGLYSARGYEDEVEAVDVWEPYFEPWLLDLLRESVFDHVGSIATLTELGDELGRLEQLPFESTTSVSEARIVTYLLAGERERAEAAIADKEGRFHKSWIDEQRALLDRDIEALCAACHQREERTAEALKLGDRWQPTPFPIELPKPVRRAKTAEQPFATTPWPPRPDGIVAPPPQKPGEVAYARAWSARKGNVVMVAPLTPDTARAMHDNHEGYCVFARLSGGLLLVVRRRTHWSPHDPQASPLKPELQQYELRVQGASWLLTALFNNYGRVLAKEPDADSDLGALKLCEVEIHEIGDPWPYWHASTGLISSNPPSKAILIWDTRLPRVDDMTHVERLPFSLAEHAFLRRPLLAIGEHEGLWERVLTFLEFTGYGKLA